MTTTDKHSDQADLYSVAADWHNRIENPASGPVDRARLDVWLSADPRHAAAYRSIERTCDTLDRMAADPRILAFRREALVAASSGNHVVQSIDPWMAPGGATRWLPRVVAAVAMVIVAASALYSLPSSREEGHRTTAAATGEKLDAGTFSTTIGEQSTIPLSDGSSVVLDTQSRIEVRYSPQQRGVRLVSGQAWFQVARNPAWPFVVDAGDRRITALGTAFDVRLENNERTVLVTLVEGKVAVEAIGSPLLRMLHSAPPASVLAPGESLVVSGTRPAVSTRADLAKVGSWRQGQIIFDGDTLQAAVAEMNRYSTRQIVLADATLGALRVSGVFKAGHSQNFVETVTGYFPVSATEEADGRVVLRVRPAPSADARLPEGS